VQSSEVAAKQRWEERHLETINKGFHTTVAGTAGSSVIQLINKATGIMVITIGATLVLKNEMTLGQLIAFRIISGYVTQPIIRLAACWQSFQEASLSMEHLSEAVNQPLETKEDEVNNIPMPTLRGEIIFEQVSFNYGSGAPQLSAIDLEIPAGDFIGLVGQSGCGKSTLLKLIARLYNPSSGRVLIDGLDIEKVELHSLRRQIGYVPQECLLFEGSIFSNIASADPDADSNAVIHAAQLACAHDFIMAMDEGYTTRIGEKGAGLSGGQRQRIALARMLLQRPRLIILDEATSALDVDTENQVLNNLLESARDSTIFMTTHRLSSLSQADRIVLLHNGSIDSQGTHARTARSAWSLLRPVPATIRRLNHDGPHARLNAPNPVSEANSGLEPRAYGTQGVLLHPPPLWTRILIWTLGLGTIVLLVWSWFTRLEETVSMDGGIETATPEAKVTSANDGQIEAVLVRPDQSVHEGDSLFRLSNQDVNVTITGLNNKLAELENEREREHSLYEAKLDQLKTQAKLHRTILEKLTKLADTGAAQDVQVIERQSSLQETLNAMDVAKKEFEKADNILVIQKVETNNAIRELLGKRSDNVVAAPVTGTVHALMFNAAGERVKAGDQMATIVPSLQLLAAVSVPSRISAPVKKGNSAKLSVDAFPSNDFGELSGKIISVSPNTDASQEAGKESNYRAMIAIDRSQVPPRFPIDQLRPGMGVKAKVRLRDRAVITLVFDFLDKAIQPLTQRF
jgi:ABC-type multidrug transport system ATPase subunit/multidrug efflux pump subunit AcrA (membrane-fusion protein)